MRTAVAVPVTAASDAAGLAQIARIKGLAQLGRGTSDELAIQFGSPRVQKAVAAMHSGNTADMLDLQIIVGAFIQQMRNTSAFYRLIDSMVRVPFRSRISIIGADATAWIVGEGKPVPVGRITLDKLTITPDKAAALIVLTEELLRGTQSERNLSLALRRAITAAVDSRFFALVIDGDTPTLASSGSTAADAVEDVRTLLDLVKPSVESSMMFVMAPDVQRAGAMLTNAGGDFQFPDLTPTGGDIKGIPAIPSDQVPAGSMTLIDATGIAGDTGNIDIDSSDQATIEMLDTALQQDATTGTPAPNLVSMFQTNSVAIRATVDFGAQRIRDTAIARITGIEWGQPA